MSKDKSARDYNTHTEWKEYSFDEDIKRKSWVIALTFFVVSLLALLKVVVAQAILLGFGVIVLLVLFLWLRRGDWFCPECGGMARKSAEECSECGFPIPDELLEGEKNRNEGV